MTDYFQNDIIFLVLQKRQAVKKNDLRNEVIAMGKFYFVIVLIVIILLLLSGKAA
ncbi:MAG: hypothetical protein IJ563_05130 [Selenomonadaceae bacterium]|nr:hypothetical protein [Selenomonadaceae bacterium]